MALSFDDRYNQLTGGVSDTQTSFVQSTPQPSSDFESRFNKLTNPEPVTTQKNGSLFKQISDFVTTKLNSITPGGVSAGIQRVKQTPLKEYFMPTATKAQPARQYITDTFKEAVNTIEGVGKLTPAYMAYRAVINKPITPQEYLKTTLQSGLGVLNVSWRVQPAAPLIGAGFNSWKGVRQYLEGKISAGELIETPITGINNQPGLGEAITDNVKLAEAIDIVFMASMFVTPFAKKKLGQLNLQAEELNKVSKVLGVKPNASMEEVSKAFKEKVRQYPDTFTSNPKPENVAIRKELTDAFNILKQTRGIDKKYAEAYNFIQEKLGKVGIEVKAPEMVKEPLGLTRIAGEQPVEKPIKTETKLTPAGEKTVEAFSKAKAEVAKGISKTPVTPKTKEEVTTEVLKDLTQEAKDTKSASEFVSTNIFDKSLSGVVTAEINKNYKGATFADKLEDFYNQANERQTKIPTQLETPEQRKVRVEKFIEGITPVKEGGQKDILGTPLGNQIQYGGKDLFTPSGMATTGSGKIGDFENVPAEKQEISNFKLFEKVRGLTDKYIEMIGKGTLGERYTPRRAIGVFYPDTYNVRVNGMNDLSVASHEDSHLLDTAYNISDALLEVKGWSKNGKPIYSPTTRGIRKEITDLYVEYYPTGKKTHKLKKRAVEGFATLMQKYTEIPTTITEKYPKLVKEFLTEGGKYYKPVIGEMLTDLRNIVSEYQKLNPLDKIGARVTKNAIEPKEHFLNLFEKVRTFVEDEIYPVEKVAKLAGVHFTKNDPSLWLRAMQTGGGVYANNILTNRGYWAFRKGDFVKVHDFNWKTLVDHLNKEKIHDSFGYYLVARREHFAYQELVKYKAKFDEAQKAVKEMGKDAAVMTDENGKTPIDIAREAGEEYSKLKKVLDNDGFTEEEVSEAYLANKDRFKEEEKVFDTLVREDLNLLHDEEVQLVNNETFEKLTDQKGYATFKRRFEDELVGEEGYGAVTVKGGVKASFLKSRTGSARAIIDPVASSMRNHIEAVKKGMRQIVYNKIGNIAEEAVIPDMFQKLQLQVTADEHNRIYYPQEKDPNIIMARINYKRVPILTNRLIKSTIDNTLTFQSMNLFEKVLVASSRMFTVGTTGLYPAFAATNFAADQWNAIVNSRNKYTPLVDSLKILKDGITKQGGEVGRIYQMYEVLGGSRLTLSNFLSLPADEAVKAVINERNGIQKALDLIDKGINIFSIPSNTSETVTRFSEFYKAIKAGKSQVVALEEAARITGPFHHIGSWRVKGASAKNMIRAMPFANASLQILTQLIRTGSDSTEGRKRIAFTMAALVALYLSSIASVSLFGTDDQKEQYKDLKATDIGMFLYFPFTNGKGLIRVKVSPELSFLATLMAMKINEQIFNVEYKLVEYADALFNILPQQLQMNDPAAAFLSWFSPIVKVPFELIANIKDYPSVRPIEGLGMQYKAPGERYNESTSTLAKVVGGKLNLSPLKIDFLISGIFGRYTGFLTGKPGIYSIQSAYLRDYYFTMGRRVENFYDGYEKAVSDWKQIEKFPANERSKVAKTYGQYTRVNDLLKLYRDIDLKKDPLKAQLLRTKILNEINKLSGEGKQSSSQTGGSPIAGIISGAGKLISKLTPVVSASENGKTILGIEMEGNNVVTRYVDEEGRYSVSYRSIDSDLTALKYIGKIFNDIGTKLGLPEMNISEKFGYKSREERVKEILSYNDQLTKEAKKINVREVTPTPTPTPELSKALPSSYDKQIKDTFGDQGENALRVLKRKTANGEVVGENTSGGTGADLDYTNKDGSVDRGLFRINSRTFNDFMRRKPKILKANGITNFDDMLDPEKNIKMAKILYDEQGWDAWVAAPKDLLSDKEIERRKKQGVSVMD